MFVVVIAVIMIVLMVVFVMLGWCCVQLLIRSLVRRYLVCFRHLTRVQFNAFQGRPLWAALLRTLAPSAADASLPLYESCS
jgi:hypothetical protein